MKKITSILLTALMLAAMLSVFAVPASAETGTIDGTDITWELTENDTVLPDGKTGRTLTIGGKGEMPGYNATTPTLDKRPWKDYIETITTVMIESGVTNIGNYAFWLCASLQSVTIPSGVTSIGNNAFSGTSLQSVIIPYGVTSIGNHAFSGTSLQSVIIPYGVTSIGPSAFMDCTNLQSVTIPSSVTKIADSTFNTCNQLASVTVKASTPPTLKSRVFEGTPGNLAIYVPCGAGTAYQEAWSGNNVQIKEAYVVDDQPGENGTIMLDKDCFPKETYTEPSETVTVTVMPADGYRLKADSLSVVAENGAAIALTQDETDPMKYTFTMPCSNVTVKAEFEKIADESEPAPTATVFSEGTLWIIIAVAVVVIAGIATLVIVKKKKKPATAEGVNTDEK